jgi:hypothetical protein
MFEVLWVPADQVGTALALLWGAVLLIGGGGLALMRSASVSQNTSTYQSGQSLLRLGALALVPAVTLSLSALGSS